MMIIITILHLSTDRKEVHYNILSQLLRTQIFGFFYPCTSMMTYVICVTYMMIYKEMTLEQAIRVVGWMDNLKVYFSYDIPKALYTTVTAYASLKRIEVKFMVFK